MITEKEAIEGVLEKLRDKEPSCDNCHYCGLYVHNPEKCEQRKRETKKDHEHWELRIKYWEDRLKKL